MQTAGECRREREKEIRAGATMKVKFHCAKLQVSERVVIEKIADKSR